MATGVAAASLRGLRAWLSEGRDFSPGRLWRPQKLVIDTLAAHIGHDAAG